MDSKGVITGAGAALALFWAASFTKDISDTTWQQVEFNKDPVEVALQDGNYEAIETSVTTGHYKFRSPLQAISVLSLLCGLGASWYAWQSFESPAPSARKPKKSTAKPAPAKVVSAPVQPVTPQVEKAPEPIVAPVAVIQEPLANLARETEEELEADVWEDEDEEDEEDDRPGLIDRVVQVFATPSEDLIPTLDRLTGRYQWLQDVVLNRRLIIVCGPQGSGKTSVVNAITGARLTLPEKPHKLGIIDIHASYGQYAPYIERDFEDSQRDDSMEAPDGYPWIKVWGLGNTELERAHDAKGGLDHFLKTVEERYRTMAHCPPNEWQFENEPITYLWEEVAHLTAVYRDKLDYETEWNDRSQKEAVSIRKANVYSMVVAQGKTATQLGIAPGYYDTYYSNAACIELLARPDGEERPSGKAKLIISKNEQEVDVPMWFFTTDRPVTYKRFFPDLV